MKIKAAPIRVKAGPDDGLEEGQFEAYASVFDNKDSYGDVVRNGAFTETLADWEASGNVLPLLFGHRMDDPDFNIGGVLEAAEDDHGLKVRAQLDLENPKAAQVYRLLKGKRISQMSFAYDVVEGAWAESEELGEFYELRKLRLYEVSVVPVGANQETEVLGVKAAADALVAGMKAGRVLSAKNEESLREALAEIRAAAGAIDNVLAAAGGEADQEKASGHTAANADASAEEPSGAKAPADAEEQRVNPSARALATLSLLALAEGEGGAA